MPNRPAFARISITLPRPVLAAADKLAKRLDRSRSWVISEAVRRLGDEPANPAPATTVHEPAILPSGQVRARLGEFRLEQLRADLSLTPEARVRAAEDTERTSRLIRPSTGGQRLQFFDRFEDYLDWKQREEILA